MAATLGRADYYFLGTVRWFIIHPMSKKTSQRKTQRASGSKKQVRRMFAASEVGVLIEDFDRKFDMLVEAFSAQESRTDKIEENTLLIQENILTIEDKIMIIEDKLIRIESAVAALTETVSTNAQDIQVLKSRA